MNDLLGKGSGKSDYGILLIGILFATLVLNDSRSYHRFTYLVTPRTPEYVIQYSRFSPQ